MRSLRGNRLLAADRRAGRYHAATIGLGALASLAVVAQALLISRVVSRVWLGADGARWDLAAAAPTLALLLALALGRAALVWLTERTAQRGANLVKHALRLELTRKLLALGPAYTVGERSGELVATLAGGVEALDAYLARYLPQIALSALVPLLVLVAVVPLDPLSALVLLLTAPIIPVFMVLIGRAAQELTTRQWRELGRMSAHLLDVFQGLTTLKLFGRSREQAAVIERISRRFGDLTLRVLRVAFVSGLVLELTASLSTAVVAVEIGLRLLDRRLAFEQALAVLILAPEFYAPLRALGAAYHAGMAGRAALDRIAAILDTPVAAPATGVPPPHGTIRFEQVTFRYGPDAPPVLDAVSLALAPGERVALVGPSGAGKSTLASLLLRFVEPSGGRMMVGDTPLAAVDPALWRARIAWVPQRPFLLNASVAANLRVARPDATTAELVAASEAAGAHAFIAALPAGYDTPIGEGGARLSGGQRQRLAIARAFLRDAPILILDEPTAHLDPLHAGLIQAALERLMRDRTVLIIAHHSRVVAGADRVYHLAGGRLHEVLPPAFIAAGGAPCAP